MGFSVVDSTKCKCSLIHWSYSLSTFLFIMKFYYSAFEYLLANPLLAIFTATALAETVVSNLHFYSVPGIVQSPGEIKTNG